MLWITLLAYAITISLFDWRTRRIPNWATFPVLLAGIFAHFPGDASILLASLILVIAFANEWMGAGDAKLWLAILWAIPLSVSSWVIPCLFSSLLASALAQFAWRLWKRTPLRGVSGPAAWRTIPFLLFLWSVYAH